MAKPIRAVAVVAVGALGLAACASGNTGGGGGGGGKTLIIATDLPLQGSNKNASDSTNQAIQMYLDSIGSKAGNYTIQLSKYDDSTAAAAKWDSAQCQANATKHVQTSSEIAVIGTLNSGCAQIEIPILNQDPNGPMVMVSHANTAVGLTQKSGQPGEPDKYYPTGKRNYARVTTTDQVQGSADAAFAAQSLNVKKCYVLNDNETYGKGIAGYFATDAPKNGIQVVGNEPWDPEATNYVSLFQKIKASGADCVFFGGIYDAGGAQLVKDKNSVLGDQSQVKVLAPDGFTGFPALNKTPQAQGMYLSFAGLSLDQLKKAGGPGAKLIDDYTAKYGGAPASSYAIYGVAAMQVLIQALQQSDGTRKGLQEALFSKGVTVPASQSVLGKDLTIDTKTGDVSTKDITIELIKGNAETFFKVQSVS
jgi:branched-chain amino acid transport system substrate-binding protein